VLLSVATYELVRDSLPEGVTIKDLGEHALKDLLRPEHVYQLTIPDLPSDFPALKSLTHQPHNLPVQPTPFLGRGQEVASVRDLLRRPEVRMATLTGPGGIGKTRLSLQVAAELSDQFADGVFFVGLAPLNDAQQVVPAIIRTLGISEVGGQPPLALLKTALKDKHILLLLDNFEQVLDAAMVVAELLAACPKLKIMVTSRVLLHVQAEREFAVSPLSLPDPKRLPDLPALSQYEAVALFIERAQAIKADFQVTNANAPAVAGICGRLDGLPLAIELAAARVKYIPPQALLARLEQGLSVLSGGARDLPARQQTLRGAIAWSYDLLSPEEKALFRRLSVFVDGWTWEAAEAVCQAAGKLDVDVLDSQLSLVDKSLLRQRESAQGDPRFWMLQLLREFGLEALTNTGERGLTHHSHAEYFLALAEEAEKELHGPNQAAWIKKLELEHENLRAALNWALEEVAGEQAREHREMALRLSSALEAFWQIHGHYSEGRTFLERTLTQSDGASAFLRAKILGATADIATMQGDFDRAEVLAQQSLTLYRELENAPGIASCLFLLGNIAWTRGKTAEAIVLSEERIRLLRQIGQPGDIADALFFLAFEISTHGEYTRGQALLEESLMLSQKAGNDLRVGAALIESAWWLWNTLGDATTIRQRLQQGQALITRVGDMHWSALASAVAAQVVWSEGETARALSLLEESLAIFREMDSRWYVALTLQALGRVKVQQGELPAACSSYQESLALCQQLGEKWILPFNLEELASIIATQGDIKRAAQVWGAAEALREEITVPLFPVFRASYEQAVTTAGRELGEEAFAAAWHEGRRMPLEQIITSLLSMHGEARLQ